MTFVFLPNGPTCRQLSGGKIDITSFSPQTKIHSIFSSGFSYFNGFFFSCSICVLTAKHLVRTTATANKYFFMTYAAHTTMTIKWLSANDLMIRHSLLWFFYLSLSFCLFSRMNSLFRVFFIIVSACCLCAIILSGLQLLFDNNDTTAQRIINVIKA